jgi:hypothetical protein
VTHDVVISHLLALGSMGLHVAGQMLASWFASGPVPGLLDEPMFLAAGGPGFGPGGRTAYGVAVVGLTGTSYTVVVGGLTGTSYTVEEGGLTATSYTLVVGRLTVTSYTVVVGVLTATSYTVVDVAIVVGPDEAEEVLPLPKHLAGHLPLAFFLTFLTLIFLAGVASSSSSLLSSLLSVEASDGVAVLRLEDEHTERMK